MALDYRLKRFHDELFSVETCVLDAFDLVTLFEVPVNIHRAHRPGFVKSLAVLSSVTVAPEPIPVQIRIQRAINSLFVLAAPKCNSEANSTL